MCVCVCVVFYPNLILLKASFWSVPWKSALQMPLLLYRYLPRQMLISVRFKRVTAQLRCFNLRKSMSLSEQTCESCMCVLTNSNRFTCFEALPMSSGFHHLCFVCGRTTSPITFSDVGHGAQTGRNPLHPIVVRTTTTTFVIIQFVYSSIDS